MRRLKSRIAALESGRADSSDLSGAECQTLVNILARRDALFWPWRFTKGSGGVSFPEIRHRQRDYLAGTVGTAVKADGVQNWKDAHAMRQRLIAAGMITATHSSGQVQSVFLTPAGEATARALVGDRLHTLESGRIAFMRLLILSQATSCRAVRESILWDRECVGSPTDWDDKTEQMLPYLTTGLVRADTDTQGRTAYTPVDDAEAPGEISVDIEPDPAMDDFYIKAFNDERTVLSSVEPRDSHEIFIPLPATGWGWKYYFPKEFQ